MPSPTSIRFKLVESDDFLAGFAIRNAWTPFEAACLIRGLEPGNASQDPAIVGLCLTSSLTQEDLDAHSPIDHPTEHDILNIMRSIIEKWGEQNVPSSDVTQWAIGKGLLSEGRFTARVLGGLKARNDMREELALLRGENADLKADVDQLQQALKQNEAANDGRGQHHAAKRDAILGFVIRELLAGASDPEQADLLSSNDFNA